MTKFLNRMFYKHRSVHEVMTDALTSFGKGNRNARLKFLIKDFYGREAFENEIDGV